MVSVKDYMTGKTKKLSNDIKVQQVNMLDVYVNYANVWDDKTVLPFLKVLETNLARTIKSIEEHNKGTANDNGSI